MRKGATGGRSSPTSRRWETPLSKLCESRARPANTIGRDLLDTITIGYPTMSLFPRKTVLLRKNPQPRDSCKVS